MVLMFTDIVGSVDMRRRLGDTAAAKIISRHDEIFRRTVGAFPFAEILKDLGDGFLARFSSASDAVHAALHFQSTLRHEDWGGERVQARIGLHLGEVSEMEVESTTGRAKLSGLAVDMAARVMGLALPGQILMTRAAFDNARQYVREHQSSDDSGAPSVTRKWMAHGRYVFKGADEPVEVFEVGEVGIAPLHVPPDSEKARRAVAADQEETLGWRPAVGLEIPQRKNWVLERKLGEGGFGEVWLGEHTKSKAVRVFKFCFDAERLRSFKRELMLFRLLRDALGDRNDIAKLHEVQIDQAPFYLEFEFTEDGSLVEWSKAQGGIETVPLLTRLDLVAKTAVAVAAAHSVGVLHKDIKPGNVLIYRGMDGSPSPRLTDFGIGDLTDPSQLAKRNIMMTGMASEFAGHTTSGGTTTRIYAPPEVLVGRPFTIQGDVYALGVLLYQMVVGDLERPIAQGWERDVPDPLLREDISRCVEGDESKRLASAQELAERLQSLPARRRARRRRQIALASALSTVVLVLLLGIGVIFFVRERGARVRHEEEARKANAVREFMVEMFSAVDPRTNPGEGKDVKVATLFEHAVELLDDGKFADDPPVDSAVRSALGNSYKALGGYRESEAQLKKVLDFNVKNLGLQSWAVGEQIPTSLLRTHDARLKTAALAQTLEDYGAARWFQSDYRQAEELFRQSLHLRTALFGEESLPAASSMNYLAAALDARGVHDEAEALYRRTLAIREKVATGDMRIDLIARSKNNLSTCLRYQKKYAESEAYVRQAISEIAAKYGNKYVDVGQGKNNLAICLLQMGKLEEAEKEFLESLAIKREVQGPEHSSLAITLEGLAKVYREMGGARLADAEAPLIAALAIRRKYLASDNPQSIATLGLLLEVLSHQGKHAEAEKHVRDWIATLEDPQAEVDETMVFDARSRLGACLVAQGRMDEAEPLLVSSFRSLRESYGNDSPRTQAAAARLQQLIDLYQGNGHESRATELAGLIKAGS